MGKGKNHDRKAAPSFGKVKSSAQKGEFTLKRVKGESDDQYGADNQERTSTVMPRPRPG